MKKIEVRAPSLGETESSATLVRWLVAPGDWVEEGEAIAEIESDKITMEVPAPASGRVVEHAVEEGAEIQPNALIAVLDASAKPEPKPKPKRKPEASAPKAASKPEETPKSPPATAQPESMPESAPAPEPEPEAPRPEPAPKAFATPASYAADAGERAETRTPLSPIRRRIAKRLKQAQNTAAMLTTFNEVDMSAVVELRRRWKDAFAKKHGVKLGITGFFVLAACRALARFPILNAWIDGDEVVHHNYVDCGVAVATDYGLIVPVIRDAHRKGLVEIEREIRDFALRAREGTLKPEELSGGTFTITNGGVFGSMLSTPILNPPQSAILGLHAVRERPVAVNGRVEIRPVMYLALSYDHRLIDGAEAVQFLVAVKEFIEHPGLDLLEL